MVQFFFEQQFLFSRPFEMKIISLQSWFILYPLNLSREIAFKIHKILIKFSKNNLIVINLSCCYVLFSHLVVNLLALILLFEYFNIFAHKDYLCKFLAK